MPPQWPAQFGDTAALRIATEYYMAISAADLTATTQGLIVSMIACLYCGVPYERQSNLTRHLETKHDTVIVPVTINFDKSVPPLGFITIKRSMAEAFMAGKVAFTPAIVSQGDNEALQAIGMSLVIELPPDEIVDTASGLKFEPAVVRPAGV